MQKIIALLLSIVMISLLGSCFPEKLEKVEEVPYNGSSFGFESFSQQTIETTLRYRQIYFKRPGSDDKMIFIGFGSTELSYFPADPTILKNTPYTIIDTLDRTGYNLPPTQEDHTLYVDPAIFSKTDYNAILDFVNENYRQPIEKNKLVKWMDDDVSGLDDGKVYFTIYAIVYQKLSAFQPEYHAPDGEDYFRVLVNNDLVNHEVVDGMQSESYKDFIFKNDTLFYYDYIERAKVDRMLTFKNKEGVPFSSFAKAVAPLNPPTYESQ